MFNFYTLDSIGISKLSAKLLSFESSVKAKLNEYVLLPTMFHIVNIVIGIQYPPVLLKCTSITQMRVPSICIPCYVCNEVFE